VRIELTLSKEAYAKVKHAQELLSHVMPYQDLTLFLEYLSEKIIKQKTYSAALKKAPLTATMAVNIA
ncbi:MAG: hypothetical protein J7501_17755, partial [Bdellovibrio sp.]|nr:hypothetical protein [Bdellovibrio sp.]